MPRRNLKTDVVDHPHVKDAAAIPHGNAFRGLSGPETTEPDWTRDFDNQIARGLQSFDRGFDRAEAALLTVPALAGCAFRTPSRATSRLAATIAVSHAVRAAGPNAKLADYEAAIAKHLGISVPEVKSLGMPREALAEIAADDTLADDDLERDLATGLLDEARIARDQWAFHAFPTDLELQWAPDDHRFVIGDCFVRVEEMSGGGWEQTRDSTIWQDVLSYRDETKIGRNSARPGTGRHLRLTCPLGPDVQVVATFAGRAEYQAVGRRVSLNLDAEQVTEANRITAENSWVYVYGR